MTKPDEALLWARESAYQMALEEVSGPGVDVPVALWLATAYQAGAAASKARIKALEDEVRELKEALTATVMQATARQIPITNEIKFSAPIRALLKEADQ
jgi:hypothetical protein